MPAYSSADCVPGVGFKSHYKIHTENKMIKSVLETSILKNLTRICLGLFFTSFLMFMWLSFFPLVASLIMFINRQLRLSDICQFSGAVVLFYFCLIEGLQLAGWESGLYPERRSLNRRHTPHTHTSHPALTTLCILLWLPLSVILGPGRTCFHVSGSALCVTRNCFSLKKWFS